ncbi:MAG TPA: hypothetical protein VFV89_17515 [Nocardioides sp.]|uniref:hypothetical protein n=1 Tax=Nocardioides sp. TaxID=35761 RepID=UPI002E321ECD|nr:hypothetical protein [Nocardioides sp.]HEX5089610.1 hypothetical protein [Nocardioides sp.]
MHDLTAAHWVYLVGVLVILGTMLARKNIVVPAVFFTFLTALVFSKTLSGGIAAVFNASLVAGQELFSIFLIIALVTGMLGALQALGADTKMVAPFRSVMRNGHLAFWTLAVVTYLISLFFWPTPAVPLIGAVLIPVAIAAGLRPMAVAFTVAVAGQGMALSSDYVIRVAPGLSATAAGVDANSVANRGMVLSLIVGVTALVIGYVLELRRMRRPSQEWLDEWESGDVEARVLELTEIEDAPTIGHGPAIRERGAHLVAGGGEWDEGAEPHTSTTAVAVAEGTGSGDDGGSSANGNRPSLRGRPEGAAGTPANQAPAWASTAFAIAVPAAYLALIAYLIYSLSSKGTDSGLKGGDAAALVGGMAAIMIFLAAFTESRHTFLERSAEHVVDGLVFAFKAMGVVLPIAGFFFIGNGDFAGRILGVPANADGTPAGPAFLFDLVLHGQEHIPDNGFLTAFGILVIGMVAGLEGSGFSGLPLTGSLAGTLGPVTGVDSETLAAIGQMGNIWSGGGTLVAWSSLIAVAGFARVPVIELARRCFIPVVSGLVLATILAVLLM